MMDPSRGESASAESERRRAPPRLSDFIRERQTEILLEWERAARGLPRANSLDRPALLDHIPDLLERIAEMADELAAGIAPTLPRDIAERHAVERLEEGFDLGQVVTEFALLRDCIMRLWERDQVPASQLSDLRLLNQALDKAVSESVDRYTKARDRALQGLDRIASAALESTTLDDLLRRLLQVLVEATPAIDTAAILLREGERLRVRATVGLEEAVSAGFNLAIGEGFAGTIAAEKRPKFLHSASTDPLVKNMALRKKGVRALYGVPLTDTGQVIGVAHIGSLTAHEFSDQDKRLLAAMANRATAAIYQRMLRESAEHALAVVDALLSSSLIGFGFIDNQLRYVRVNDALGRMNGVSPADHEGHTVREVLGTQAADFVEPILRRVVETGEAATGLELTLAPPSTPDKVRSFLANYFPVRTPSGETLGVGAAVLEITDRARAQEALRRSEARLQEALSIETVGVLFFRLDGRMQDANHALERMSGLSRDELCSMDWHRLTPPEFTEVTARTASMLATIGEAPAYEKQWIRPDGSRWWGLFAPRRLSGSGRESECVEFIIDISERKQTEHALQGAMRAREEILAVVSHDLKNPLGTIHMAAALLARKPTLDQGVRNQVERIQRAATRMDHLISDLLDMASIQAGRLALERKSEDPRSLVLEAIETHEETAKERGMKIVSACDFQGRRLSCDRDRVLQVFGNLLGNAIKFCRSDDVITIRGEVAGNEARFAVSDTGPGIPDSELPRLFEPYWSAERHAKKGTGLGLYITRGIIEAHGGQVWVDSKQGDGATFSFTLPLAPPTDPE